MAEIKAKKVLFKNRDGESLIPYIGEDYVKNDDMVEINMREVPCIVETYVNGTSWYRVYSDGWCEQGATVTGSFTKATSFSLLKPLSGTYLVVGNAGYSSQSAYWCVIKQTANSFKGEAARGTTANVTYTLLHWYACGYIA